MNSFKYLVFMISLTYSVLAYALPDSVNASGAKCDLNKNSLFVKAIEDAVEISDPISVDSFDFSYLTDLKYHLRDAKLSGIKNCRILETAINREESSFEYTLECNRLQANSKYVMNGHLAHIYGEGEGNTTITSGHYNLKFKGYFEKIIGEDKIEYVHIKSHSIEFDPTEPVTFILRNLYGGDKIKSEILHKFVSENWKPVEEKFRVTILAGFLNRLIQNLDGFLKVIPFEQIYSQLC